MDQLLREAVSDHTMAIVAAYGLRFGGNRLFCLILTGYSTGSGSGLMIENSAPPRLVNHAF
jgi:hypothetical protein